MSVTAFILVLKVDQASLFTVLAVLLVDGWASRLELLSVALALIHLNLVVVIHI